MATLPQKTPLSVLELPIEASPAAAHRRMHLRASCPFSIQRRGEAPWHGVNLSAGGLLCAAEEPVWPGNTVDLELVLGDSSRPVRVRGEVAELVPFNGTVAMRVRFAALGAAQRGAIMQWVAQHRA